VFKIFHDQEPAVHEQMKQVHAAREELSKLAAAERFDEARARQLADAQAKALSNLAVLRAQSMYRVREVLTPEQRQKLDQRRDAHRPPA
jgi:Spy/CpxP family protein refolding chaperone